MSNIGIKDFILNLNRNKNGIYFWVINLGELGLESSAFKDGEKMPRKYGYTEENISPPLSIKSVPEGTESLALIMDDPDAKPVAGKIWTHWLIWGIDPGIGEIPEDWSSTATEGKNDYGEKGYGGPNPPDKAHTYEFKLYALDSEINLKENSKKKDVEKALKGHIIDKTKLRGVFEP
ncbi:MAG: Phospholipid-binding protein [Candidatus Methanohalarchaeum thermophilum]|uniref:Phospholipid-binding protein n=1 Tax=Methanohalarchaeum thermophilum TaxID=1903181 RepID=A0A1Q6DW24_METT1|nr:MAG: Phospholipid-binding protein [Candidatus Methanohalarchaeum thermophilum]